MRGLSIFSLICLFLHWIIKAGLILKIYSSWTNVDSWFKFWFSVEGIFSPFGAVLMRYPLSFFQVYSWGEQASEERVLNCSRAPYLKGAFPDTKLVKNKLLVLSNLSFKYSRAPLRLKRLHNYISKLERFSNVWKDYLQAEKDIQLIKNINLSLASNKFIAIVGKNGSGKSTIAKIIVHLLSNYEGQVLWAGKELKELSIKSFAQNISYIPQHSIIYHDISILDFIAIGFYPQEGMLSKKISEAEKKQKVLKVLKGLNLEKEAHKSLYSLSGGNKQKTIIARAIIQGAKIIVLDEPLNFLDIKSKILVLEYLKELQQNYGASIIMIHHDISEVKQYIDELIIIDSGYLVKHIKLENLKNDELKAI
ncbi:ABC transporter ATP-binding protein [Candidatus Mycoplasma haematominutum]|uniref:Iron (III) dicitrate transport ATP-binding protein FecE n=1 Tax=Candidatus Mycoplasma haematominutum 'Birmingham 1' TaxID=1116213 RepID=G8C2U7_9MOLU|nr:ABC transporter ATP-binding protein [Candidatus Mycoplasma haematominutum]CCE66645.1 iron (III) dicitrate transport ATP-binding protein FecE [Candidatus Mycoplasma haematominutum 'Birmingham 1']